MKRLIWILVLWCTFTNAQKSDNTWLMGYHYYPNFVPALDFYFNTPDTIAWNAPFDFFGANAGICNTTGDLQFYTNGVTICNYLNDTLDNSYNFNYDSTTMGPPYNMNQLPSQSVIIVPSPGSGNQYYIFHVSMHLFNNNQYTQPIRFSYSIVDMNSNNQSGSMIVKDQTLVSDTLLYFTLQATKHGNGRDWWVVIHRWNSNKFYVTLLTPFGVNNSFQDEGPFMPHNNASQGQSVFSPDGTHYVIARGDSNIVYLFDFDRCSGIFTYRETFSYPQGTLISGCSFSPDSRLLYVSSYMNLYQYDMLSNPVNASMLNVGVWDGSGSFNAYYFLTHRLGPDGKIYICTPASQYLHVINDPDQLDTLCNFSQHSLKLKSWHAGSLPEFPNYRLASLTGSLCDTLLNTSGYEILAENKMHVSPNPSNGDFMIEYSLTADAEGRLEVINVSGEVILSLKLSKFSNRRRIDIANQPDGIYFIRMVSGGSIINGKALMMK